MNKQCKQCQRLFDKKPSHSMKAWKGVRFCSKSCYTKWQRGKNLLGENRKDMGGWNKGRKMLIISGDKSPRWKGGEIEIMCSECGTVFRVKQYRKETAKYCSKECLWSANNFGITQENEKIRKSPEYKLWRKAVFDRDNHTCQHCLKRGGELHADHIKPFAIFPELRFAIDNGRTLCASCHRKTETYGHSHIYTEKMIAKAEES